MSDENRQFACPATGEPLDLCSCGLHAPATEAEYISPKAESAGSRASAEPAPATDTTSSASPAALQLAQEPAKPARNFKKSQERNLEVVQRIDRRLRRENGRTMLAITRAPEIDPDAPKPEGWTDKEFRIAKAAWKSTRECPAFITIAEKTYSTVLRAEALRDHDPSPNLNCDIQVFVQQNTYNYESVDAEEQK